MDRSLTDIVRPVVRLLLVCLVVPLLAEPRYVGLGCTGLMFAVSHTFAKVRGQAFGCSTIVTVAFLWRLVLTGVTTCFGSTL